MDPLFVRDGAHHGQEQNDANQTLLERRESHVRKTLLLGEATTVVDVEERARIEHTIVKRRDAIIVQPNLEALSTLEQNQARPKRIIIGKPTIYAHSYPASKLTSQDLFNNANNNKQQLGNAKVNPSLYLPTNAYNYYAQDQDGGVLIKPQLTKQMTSPPLLPASNNNNNNDFAVLENFLEASAANHSRDESMDRQRDDDDDSDNRGGRNGLVSSNYSVDLSAVPSLRMATSGIKSRRKYDEEIDELYTPPIVHQTIVSPMDVALFATSNDSVATNKSLEEDEEEDYCGSDIDGEDFASVNIDYNERFQEIMEDLLKVDCNAYQHDRIRVNSQFIALTQDFVYASQTFGKVIISERYLPAREKTIPPIDIGGLAGGDKFIVHGILFKFAIDKESFYGSDYAASCVAGHELKGLINVFNTGIRDVSLPLMALVDYRGFRVIAMSILPVDKDTIVYGSNDYGMTIHNRDPHLSSRVQELAVQLNIAGHHCGENATFLHSPADLEGHVGFDGRLYLLDFARLFPPEAPKRGLKMGHLYRLLRPEFVRNYKHALCSDSFSRFIRGHDDERLNNEMLDATMYLLNTTIPELAEELNQVSIDSDNVYHFPIAERLHKSGVNVRYLGHVRQRVEAPDMQSLIFVEMCARVVKQQLRQKLRYKMKQAKIPLEAPYRRLIVAYLNRLLGTSDKTDQFWNERMKKYLIKKFDKSLFDDEIKGSSIMLNLFSFSDNLTDGKYLLFKRIQKMTGLKFTHRINQEFLDKPNCWLERGEYPLDINDLEEIGIRVKYVPFHNVAQGYLFKVKGEMLFASDPIAANRFFLMALEKLETALETDPNNTNTLCTMGEVYAHLGEGNSQGLSALTFSLTNPYVEKAHEYFQRAIFSNRAHTTSLFRFAQLLERLQEYDRAEEYYLASLESNPNNIACLQEYGNFLQNVKQDNKAAEQLFVRVSENHQYLHVASQRHNDLNLRGSSGLLKVKHKRSDSAGGMSSTNQSTTSSTSSTSSSGGNGLSTSLGNHNNNPMTQINSSLMINRLSPPKPITHSDSSIMRPSEFKSTPNLLAPVVAVAAHHY
eukprot:gene15910-18908_t